ncbi:MAG TPA: redoxin family protein [Candidatus Limnocylindrales bacterium]|nr:redoxin family protein [Candidatus Limnocylindrales bacterium]
MMRLVCALSLAMLAAASPAVFAQSSQADAHADPATPAASKNDAVAEAALEKMLAISGNDRAALVRNLQQYLLQYPDAPRKAGVYRALVEACQQLQDDACALNYAERLIALRPDDSDMMLVAVGYLQRKNDDPSLTRAAGYVTRVIDRVEKLPPEERSPHESMADWQQRQNNLRTVLYYVRGQVEEKEHDYVSAARDLQMSYSISPNAPAAEVLGELAERKNDSAKAIEEYTLAFVLPDNSAAGRVDHHEIRLKLGNVWRIVHGTDQGLGEEILAAYDRLGASTPDNSPAARNKDAKDAFSYVLRRLDGTPMSLSTVKGRVLVLSFWATWCEPCRELEPMFNEVATAWDGNSGVTFLAVNTDEDQSLVEPFLAREKWRLQVVYADGLDDFLKVDSLPTVIVLDANGKIVFRTAGFAKQGFEASLSSAIQNALSPQ